MKKFGIVISTAFILVAASWIGNLWYYQSHQLGKPVFLEHYIEVMEDARDTIELYYLEDLHGDKKISNIFVPDYPELMVESHIPSYQRYVHQQLGKITLTMPSDVQDSAKGAEADLPVIRTVSVQYDDGSTEETNIGEIRFIEGASMQAYRSPVAGNSSGGGNGGGFQFGYREFQVIRPVQLQKIESSYLSLVEAGQLELYLDYPWKWDEKGTFISEMEPSELGKPLKDLTLPLQLQKGKYFRIKYRYPDNEEKSGFVYKLIARLQLEEPNGKKWDESITINVQPYLSESMVRDFVKERKE